MSSLPLQFLMLTLAGWMTRDQQRVTDYLLAENAVLRQQLGGKRIPCTDAQRRQARKRGEEARAQRAREARRWCTTRFSNAPPLVPHDGGYAASTLSGIPS
jgi:hypothetical protein